MDPNQAVELALIGGGNMGAALLAGLLDAGAFAAADVAVVEPLEARRDQLAAEFPGVRITATLPPCRSAVLAVKPPQVTAVAADAAVAGADRVLSIAAGISTHTIAEAIVDALAAGDHDTTPRRSVAVLRAMPNTPALVGAGMSALTAGPHATEDDLRWAEGILEAVGRCVRVEESALDAVTAVTGSGPAYLFLVAEALIAAGRDVGLPEDLVGPMVTQLMVGSAALLAERGDPAALRVMVTSPGGTTAAGLDRLEAYDLRGAVLDAVRAAAARSRELGR